MWLSNALSATAGSLPPEREPPHSHARQQQQQTRREEGLPGRLVVVGDALQAVAAEGGLRVVQSKGWVAARYTGEEAGVSARVQQFRVGGYAEARALGGGVAPFAGDAHFVGPALAQGDLGLVAARRGLGEACCRDNTGWASHPRAHVLQVRESSIRRQALDRYVGDAIPHLYGGL